MATVTGLTAARTLAIETALAQHKSTKQQEVFAQAGSLAVTTGASRLYNRSGVARTIVGVYISCGSAPAGTTGTPITGASLVVDVNLQGSSIFTAGTRPRILSGANTDTQDRAPSNTAWLDGQYLTVDIDYVGSTPGSPGANLTLVILWTET